MNTVKKELKDLVKGDIIIERSALVGSVGKVIAELEVLELLRPAPGAYNFTCKVDNIVQPYFRIPQGGASQILEVKA